MDLNYMTKNEFITAISEKTGYTKKDIRVVVDAMKDIVYSEVTKCHEVKIFDGVTIMGQMKQAAYVAEKIGGEKTKLVPAHVIPKAKFGAALKKAIN